MKTKDTEPRREAQEIHGFGRIVIWLGCSLIKLWLRTLRMRADAPTREILSQGSGVYMMWHNRLFMIPELCRRYMLRPGRLLHGLISGSKDGAWLSGVFRRLYIEPIRGSSSWRGTEALREIVRVVRNGYEVGLTPDGPRGPCYSMKKGALIAAKTSKAPIILLGVNPARVWRLKSWDRFYLPVPFTRTVVVAEHYADFAALETAANGEDVAEYTRKRLMALAGMPDWKPGDKA